MAEVTQFVLADGQATPVNHTFKPDGEKNGVLFFADRSTGVPVGFSKLSISQKETSGGSGKTVTTLKVVVPTLEQTSASTATGIQPAPTLAYNTAVTVTFETAARSTTQNRADILAFVKNLLADSNIGSAVTDYEKVYI
jgi:hypothetical protein